MEKRLIVGIDPGTTVGLALLDVDGNVLGITSSRNMSIDDVITKIASVGKAVVIATDRESVPPFVKKLSGILGARIFSPDYDLSVERKRELAERANASNDHERDALAAAVYAYHRFQNKIRRVEKQVQEQLEEIKGRVLKGEKVSDMMAQKKDSGREKELRAQISALRREIRELRAENESLSRSRTGRPSKSLLREAGREAKKLMIAVSNGGLVLLRDVPGLRFLDLKDIDIRKGEFILCRGRDLDSKGLRFLEGSGVGAVIFPKELDILAPSCRMDDIAIISWEGLFFADPLKIGRACGRRREVAARDLEDMVVEYKQGRG